jgi:hypothetical protein
MTKKNKKSAPSTPVFQQPQKTEEPKSSHHSKEQKRTAPTHTDDKRTSSVTVPTPKIDTIPTSKIDTIPTRKIDTIPAPTITVLNTKQMENNSDDLNESIDEDVDELLGKLERMSSIRSSVKRKIQPKDDIMQQSYSELDPPANNKFLSGGFTQNQPSSSSSNRTDRNGNATLPDIVDLRQGSSPRQATLSSTSNPKTNDNGLCVLGYQNVKSTPVHAKLRQELDYLDREELLHVIAFQSDLLKKRDTRLKDLENYTDSLLVKILEQCPTILQNGTLKYSSN